jgi:hypothetical protein
MKKPPDETRIVIKWPKGIGLPDPLELMRPRSGSIPADVEAKIVHTTAFFETYQNRFGYPNRRAQPLRMVNGEIGEHADANKTEDAIEWHANVLSRLRKPSASLAP